jgi:hypothetical protein
VSLFFLLVLQLLQRHIGNVDLKLSGAQILVNMDSLTVAVLNRF